MSDREKLFKLRDALYDVGFITVDRIADEVGTVADYGPNEAVNALMKAIVRWMEEIKG